MEEREEDKPCWNCKHLDLEKDYCECEMKSLNVILDLSLQSTLECDDFETIK